MLEFVKLQLQLSEHFRIEIQTIRSSLRTFSDDRIGLFGVAYEIRGNLFVDEIIIERLKKLGCTIVLSTHILSDVERVANRIGIVNGGMIAEEGDMSTILRKYGGDVISMSVRNLTQEQKIALLKINFARAEFNNDTGVFRFGTDNADETSKRLIKLAADNNMVIEDYKIGTATLEEVFRKVVG